MSDYRIIDVSPLNKKKYKISLEGTEMVELSLYLSELRKFSIKEGNLLTEADYNCIKEILYKRGKERALYYLKSSDKTAAQMRSKLKEGCYPESVIDKILEFLENYGYIDDVHYAERFIQYNRKRKSYQRIKNDLRIKGISRDNIEEAFGIINDESSDKDNSQADIIKKYIVKKLKPDMDLQYKSKIIMSLVRKGFRYDEVVTQFREYENID